MQKGFFLTNQFSDTPASIHISIGGGSINNWPDLPLIIFSRNFYILPVNSSASTGRIISQAIP